ncbi:MULTISPECIES: beta-glucanase [Kitasatospora]|uniref:GH16 domain-containing protein n=2 Tax=Kitasatospora TaxID=2063 RepID=A0ABT1IUQ3_9ACTN|nr:beta-glucanase [Kitasatospora paracochleata]MCP2308870.1 hypothetical protein [Kitasatospora paracochleata]
MFITRLLALGLVLAGHPAAAAEPPAVPGDRVVFSDRFDSLSTGPDGTWGWQSSAYADCTTNPGSWKKDRLARSALDTADGHLVITATPRSDGRWDTGLLTTGDSCRSGGNGAQVRTGDLLLAHIRLPAAGTGAWPGLWTWRDGHNEVDVFEWHADFPGNLEFVNHVRSGGSIYTDEAVGADRWIYIGARFGADNTTWYAGPDLDRLTAAYSDHTGVGPDFAAYPILNLSISDGSFHRPPASGDPVTMECDLIMIERPQR